MHRRIGVVTGTRAEYGYLKPLMTAIEKHSKLELVLYVTGMHLIKEYGNSIQEILNDGFKIAYQIDMGSKPMNTDYELAISISKGIKGFAKIFCDDRPDILVVFGDRNEPFAATVAATTMNIPVAHVAGGEVGFGDIDHVVRHAITKLSHLHFVESNDSMNRVLKMGEEPWRIFNVGALTLDTILSARLLTREEIMNTLGIKKKYFLVVYHPATTEWNDAPQQMALILKSVISKAKVLDMEIAIIYPNDYPGGTGIVEQIEQFAKLNPEVHVFKNLSHILFVSLMANAEVFIGNSSSGIIEAPSLAVPYVCIGTRQSGRERAANVIDVKCNEEEITAAIDRTLTDSEFIKTVEKRTSPYGDGTASSKIVKILSEMPLDKKLLQKKMTY